ncbi:MAG: hypothetical protein GIKADHBN_00465 [Phycisphaerales bacterium]|nr:hypothetical protein [Phycisphaerales bacterium]
MQNRAAMCLAALGLSMGAATTQAATLFEQLPNYVNAYFSDYSGNFPDQEMADNFVLASNNTIGQVGFWGAYYPHNVPSDNFTVNIYADGGGIPGTLLSSESGTAASRVDTGNDAFGVDVYEYNIVLNSPFAATGGTQYWLSVVNSTGAGGAGSWAWMTAGGDFYAAFSLDSTSTWNAFSDGLSMRLGEVIPAPTSLALAGLVGLGALRRRR